MNIGITLLTRENGTHVIVNGDELRHEKKSNYLILKMKEQYIMSVNLDKNRFKCTDKVEGIKYYDLVEREEERER